MMKYVLTDGQPDGLPKNIVPFIGGGGIKTVQSWGGWPCPGSIPSAGHFSRYVTSRPGQPGHPFVGRRNEYEARGGDALRLWGKGIWFVCGWQVNLC